MTRKIRNFWLFVDPFLAVILFPYTNTEYLQDTNTTTTKTIDIK